ncbi:hypothetical protein FOL47_008770 [Perkinsus chesapeaki]|uniref:RRM domain-containing protein n=1 Tax=Perkinsus chesapeaki TaxID=330153 RepID=A0A7J6MU26_PERCH|nr:hypothetical protein FOL47_008770 [Perkinsus chesapeaki]
MPTSHGGGPSASAGAGLWSSVLASVVRAMDTPPKVGEEITFIDSQGYQCTARIVRRVQPSEEPEVSSTFRVPAEAIIQKEGSGGGLDMDKKAGAAASTVQDLGSMKLSVRNSFLHVSMSDTAYDEIGAKGAERLQKRRTKSADATANGEDGNAPTTASTTVARDWQQSDTRQAAGVKPDTPPTGVSEVPTVNPSSSISQREPNSMVSSVPSSSGPCNPPSSLVGSEVRDNPNDPRTTLMIRNIPTKFTQSTLLEVINTHGFSCTYDFFYLPIDFRSEKNLGYAFVNFTSPQLAQAFKRDFHHKKLKSLTSRKVLEITYARLQGLQANIDLFRSSAVTSMALPQYKPLVFTKEGVPMPISSLVGGGNNSRQGGSQGGSSYGAGSSFESETAASVTSSVAYARAVQPGMMPGPMHATLHEGQPYNPPQQHPPHTGGNMPPQMMPMQMWYGPLPPPPQQQQQAAQQGGTPHVPHSEGYFAAMAAQQQQFMHPQQQPQQQQQPNQHQQHHHYQ